MLGWNGSVWFAILMSSALKSTAVLGTASLLAFLMRGRSAAARHLVWTGAAAAILMLPLLTIALPEMRLTVSTEMLAGSSAPLFRAIGIAGSEEAPDSKPARLATPGATNPAGSTTHAASTLDLRPWVVAIWALGAAAAFLKTLLAYLRL